VISSQLLDAYRLSYEQRSTTPSYVRNGLIVDLHIGTEPNGTITAAITLPITQHELATTILNSLQTTWVALIGSPAGRKSVRGASSMMNST